MARLRKKMSPADKARKKDLATDVEPSEAGKKTVLSKAAATKDADRPTKLGQAAVKVPGEPNIIQKSLQFLREVRIELKKVTWPNRKQTAGSTLVVIILVFIIASFLGLFDIGLSKLVQIVLA